MMMGVLGSGGQGRRSSPRGTSARTSTFRGRGPTRSGSALAGAVLADLGSGVPHGVLGLASQRVVAALLEGQLACQLLIAGESRRIDVTPTDRGQHGAVRLLLVATVREPATSRELLDVGERSTEAAAVTGQRQAADPRRVDENAAGRHDEQMPAGGRMATATVAFPHGANCQRVVAQQT